MTMDVITKLEVKLEGLIRRIKELEADNQSLKVQLEQERQDKDEVRSRIDRLLNNLDELNV